MTTTLITAASTTDDSIVDHARRWHRLGGGSAEEILLRFGLDVAQFSQRVLTLVDSAELPATEADRIRRVYRARLWSLRR